MTYNLIYNNEICGMEKSMTLQFSTLEEARERLQLLKKAFEDECEDSEFLDCISIEDDTPDHYEATDGEDWINIRILTEA